MRFYSLDVERWLSPDQLDVPADLVGHHLRLQLACAQAETLGTINDSRGWSESRWWALARIRLKTLRRLIAAGLARWVDDRHLVVENFNSYGVAKLWQRRCDGSKYAKLRWSGSRSPIGSPNAKDLISKRDLGGDRSSGRPAIAPSSSSIEVVDAGGGGLPDGVWERIWAELPNRRPYWEDKARNAIEAVVVPDEVLAFLDFLNSGKKTRSWQKSPPTPLMIAADYRHRRRAPPAATRTKSNGKSARNELPSRAEIRATWTEVTNRARSGKETAT